MEKERKITGKTKNGLVNQYHNACLRIAEKFWNKYYSKDYEETFRDDYYFYFSPIGGEKNGVWEIDSSQWWTVSDMATALEYKATKKQIEEWYWATIGELDETKRKHQNLKNFLLYKWINPILKKGE